MSVFDQLSTTYLLFSGVIVLIASLVRGYSGFGFTAIAIAGLTIFLPPAQVIPAILLIEIIAGVSLLPSVFKYINYRQLGFTFFAALVSTPLGVFFLKNTHSDTISLVISVLVLIFTLLLWRGFRINDTSKTGRLLFSGATSGLVNGVAGVGGLPMVVFFLSGQQDIYQIRATLLSYLILLDIYTCLFATAAGVITYDVLALAAAAFIPAMIGTILGNKKFLKSPPEFFRKITLCFMAAIASVGIIREIL
ncbi:sulfite exporter TauE/SafE family protein [Pelagibaculum spongiae]|uniref:Probable membrane transporter protein n=1 Tax=Pelagibaculum spongiae TaxID=2080658 RepID=A0A2V1GWY2_9GAMM|nr:sulfite exporter TauE/SafE family protein [Pelagibaculum spongiae]PVZ63938.1 hypothetical protein DC094_20675 [Pelagibaculum spongiae]